MNNMRLHYMAGTSCSTSGINLREARISRALYADACTAQDAAD